MQENSEKIQNGTATVVIDVNTDENRRNFRLM